ncbi:hypothetical protein ACFTZ8_28105 [Streptomyces fungicidicus]|uniref:hypothetical protein n=1 Tax=Streptomyces fungicidicus TaxID=68203 RepID=UPI00363BC06C
MTTPRSIVCSSRVLAAVLATGTLLTTAACSSAEDGASAGSETASAAVERARATQTGSPTSTASSPTASSSASQLTETGAKNALITAADIEDNWTQVENPQAWKDSLLVGKVDVAAFVTGKSDAQDCQNLVGSLYDETLLGSTSGASALTGFQEDDARLLYQVASYDKAALDKSMTSLQSLPDTCDQFTLTGGDNGDRTVQVVAMSLPDVGDARQGMTVTVKGDSNGRPVTLTVDVAVVQVGANAITVTNGGTAGISHDTTTTAVKQGTQRLQEVLAGGTPQPTPSGIN